MDCNCLVYKVDESLIDVAAYDIDCFVHGWRWDYDGKILSLEQYQEIDQKNAELLGYQFKYNEENKKLIYF